MVCSLPNVIVRCKLEIDVGVMLMPTLRLGQAGGVKSRAIVWRGLIGILRDTKHHRWQSLPVLEYAPLRYGGRGGPCRASKVISFRLVAFGTRTHRCDLHELVLPSTQTACDQLPIHAQTSQR